ncbi:hypothetical protein BJV77DRAFT_742451 [Russula vinacea]|nr:hypothetical protein BJV77DRAFT_742451 [Russula vinacea]
MLGQTKPLTGTAFISSSCSWPHFMCASLFKLVLRCNHRASLYNSYKGLRSYCHSNGGNVCLYYCGYVSAFVLPSGDENVVISLLMLYASGENDDGQTRRGRTTSQGGGPARTAAPFWGARLRRRDSSVPGPGQLCSDVTVKQDVFLLFHLHFCFRTLDASFFRVASTPYPDLTPQLVG